MKTLFKIFLCCFSLFLLTFMACGDDDKAREEAKGPIPVVTSFTPNEGEPGSTEITIIGENFSNNIDDVRVWLNGVEAEAVLITTTTTEIKAIIPAHSTTGLITVEVNNQFGSSTIPFKVLALPKIFSYSKNKGQIGDIITITGENFDNVFENNIVNFNGTSATILNTTTTTIEAIIPEDATNGSITVTSGGVTATGGFFRVVFVPTIELVTPSLGLPGTEVTITGTNFSIIPEENLLFFHNTPATVISSTPTTITATVPVGAEFGKITIDLFEEIGTSPEDFIPAASGIILNIPLAGGNDDVEEIAIPINEFATVGFMDLTSSDLEIGEMSSNQGLMNIGIYYRNVTIDRGTPIVAAIIQFNADNIGDGPVELTIFGENAGNPLPYAASTIGNLSARTLTTASEVWSVPPWVNFGDRGAAQRTVNIASIIEEIINRPDWVSGNNINIIMKHTGVSTGVTATSGGREAEDYSSSRPDHGAELTIVYQ